MNQSDKLLESHQAVFLSSDGMPSKVNAKTSSRSLGNNFSPQSPQQQPLLHLDVSFDALKINNLTIDLKNKANQKKLGEYFKQMADSLQKDCHLIINKNPSLPSDNLSNFDQISQDSRALRFGVDRMCERILIIGASLIKQNKFKNATQQRISQIQSILAKKLDSQEFIQKIDKFKSKTNSDIDQKFGGLSLALESKTNDLSIKISSVQNKLDQMEQKTLWKIKDCQELLRSRVSQNFVDQAMQNIEKRFYSQLDEKTQKIQQEMTKIKQKTSQTTRNNRQYLGDKITAFKTNIRNFQQKLNLKADQTKIRELDSKIIDQKSGTGNEFQTVHNRLSNHEERLNQMIRKIQSALIQINDFTSNPPPAWGSSKKSRTKMSPDSTILSPHSPNPAAPKSPADLTFQQALNTQFITSNDQQPKIKRIQEEIKKINKRLQNFTLTLDTKVDNAKFLSELSTKIDRQEAIELIPKEQQFQQKLDDIMLQEKQKLIKSVIAMTKAQDMKIVKLRNDVNLPRLNRALKQKAEAQAVSAEIHSITSHAGNLDARLSILGLDIQTLSKHIAHLQQFEQEMQQLQKDSLIGKRNIQCISCGRGDIFGVQQQSHINSVNLNNQSSAQFASRSISNNRQRIMHQQSGQGGFQNSLPVSPNRNTGAENSNKTTLQPRAGSSNSFLFSKSTNPNITQLRTIPSLLHHKSQQSLSHMAGGQFKLNKSVVIDTGYTDNGRIITSGPGQFSEQSNSLNNQMAPKHHHLNVNKLASNINAIVSSRPGSSSRYGNKHHNSSTNKIIHSKRGSTGMTVNTSQSIFASKIVRNSSIGESTVEKLQNDAQMRRATKIGGIHIGPESEKSNKNVEEYNCSSVGNYSQL